MDIKNSFMYEQARFTSDSCIVKITCLEGIPQSDRLQFDNGVAYDSYKLSMYGCFQDYIDDVSTF
jgi:hypothetical protein